MTNSYLVKHPSSYALCKILNLDMSERARERESEKFIDNQ
jgi:hypothetical protein